MMMILGLDVSSTISGIAIVEDGEIIYSEVCDTRNRNKFPHTNDIAEEARRQLEHIAENYEIDKIYVEQRLLGFMKGRTSTKTIVKLAEVNAIFCYLCEDIFDIRPEMIRAVTARKKVGIDTKGLSGKDAKEHILECVEERVSDFEYKLTRYGNPKPGSFDRADAYVIACAGELMCEEENSES